MSLIGHQKYHSPKMNSSVFLLLIWTTVLGASITKGPEIVRFTRRHGPWITRGTRRPPSEVSSLHQKREAFLFQKIGHFPSSTDPSEVVHFTKVNNPPEVESFKFSFPPKTRRTIGPYESFASKKVRLIFQRRTLPKLELLMT